MRYSDSLYPLACIDLPGMLKRAWEKGWLDEYDENHFLIKAIYGKLDRYRGYQQYIANNLHMWNTTEENFQINFCMNLSSKLAGLSALFGEEEIQRFIEDQLSAGKAAYDEEQFFRALSEVSVLTFWRRNSKTGEYEPKTNGKKNPEARFSCVNGVTVDVEVKTPGFPDVDRIREYAIPTVLLDDKGAEFTAYCDAHGLTAILPRVFKLKEFLNSAADKFEEVNHVDRMNFLYINWTFSEYPESGFLEAYGLLANPDNGLLVNRSIGKEFGISNEVYEKITAVIVYTESLNGLMFGDFRYVWTRAPEGHPHFAIIGMHNEENLFETTGMNAYGNMPVPALLYLAGKDNHWTSLMDIIFKHIKR